MTYTVCDCKRYYCKHYYGQCQWNRQARIIENEVYCEDEIGIDDLDYNDVIEIE